MSALANKLAFPQALDSEQLGEGMTMRQHYAGLAMQGLLATPRCDGMKPSDLAEEALNYTDALIAELEKEAAR